MKSVALWRLSVQLQPEAAKGELAGVQAGVQAVQVQALAAVPRQQQAALRVQAQQARLCREALYLAGLAFSRLLQYQPECLLQAYSPHAVLVPAQWFE